MRTVFAGLYLISMG